MELAAETSPDALLVVQEALERLAEEDGTKAELVKLRFFVGLTHAEAAEVLGLSEPTVKRHWQYARAWLLHEIRAILAEGLAPGKMRRCDPFRLHFGVTLDEGREMKREEEIFEQARTDLRKQRTRDENV